MVDIIRRYLDGIVHEIIGDFKPIHKQICMKEYPYIFEFRYRSSDGKELITEIYYIYGHKEYRMTNMFIQPWGK